MTPIAVILALAATYYLTHKGNSQNIAGFLGFSALVVFGMFAAAHVFDTWTPQSPAQMASEIQSLVRMALWVAFFLGAGWILWMCLANYIWDAPEREARRQYDRQVRQREIARQQAAIYERANRRVT